MPLKLMQVPSSLEDICLGMVVSLILNSCKRNPKGESKAIEEVVRTIPVTLANDYMRLVLQVEKEVALENFNIRDAFCLWCTRISLATLEEEITLLNNLDILRNLTHLWLGWFHIDKQYPEIACMVSRDLPGLRKLKSLRLATVVTNESDLFKRLAKYCPDLEELAIKWGLSRNQPATLSRCLKLKRVYVEYCGKSVDDVIYILDKVPQLETMLIQRCMIIPLLRCVRKSYLLKLLLTYDDRGPKVNAVEGSNQLLCLSRHFPNLHKGVFEGCRNLGPVNRFMEMKKLHLNKCNPRQMLELNEAVFSRLVRLSLSHMPDLSSILKGAKCYSMPKLYGLRLIQCNQVDLQQLENLCPNLHELILSHCTASPINHHDTSVPFKNLRKLQVVDLQDTFNCDHFIRLSHSRDIRVMKITQLNYFDNWTVYKLLKSNPMRRMRFLSLTSNRLTPPVAAVVFSHFGHYLGRARFHGACMEKLPPEFVLDLCKKMQDYCLHLTLGSTELKTWQTAHI